MRNELMIDIETTGTEPGCKVLSLGAFGFNKAGEQVEFYRRFDHSKQGEVGLIDEENTIAWWSHPDRLAARAEAFNGKDDPAESLGEFKFWFYKNFSTGYSDQFKVWCNGLDFDFPILKEFLRRFGHSFPWPFHTQNDYHTVKNLFPDIKVHEGNVAKHTALEDAKAQMRGLRAFYDRMAKHPEAWTE